MKLEKWNDNWSYWIETDAFALVWNVPETAKTVKLPHDAMLEKRAYAESLNGGNTGFRDGAVYNYVKMLSVSREDADKTWMLRFEGVYMNAMVYVNGALAGKCPYGYTGFDVALNDYLRFGEENEVRVIVRNGGMANSRWYSGGGIYRDVYLMSAQKTYLVPKETHIVTENLDAKQANLRVHFTIRNRDSRYHELSAHIIIRRHNAVISQKQLPVCCFENDSMDMSVPVVVTDPSCWSDETPQLYTCEIRLEEQGNTLDMEQTVFGICKLLVDGKQGLRVNGKTVKLRGACVHHDNGLLGAAEYDDAAYRRVRILKEAGFNAIRMSHQPMSEAMLQACDELGMYVMDEAFDMWTRCKTNNDYALFFTEWYQKDIEAMVRKDYNHPSVIMYCIGNEIPEIGNIHGAKQCHDLASLVRSLDQNRPVTAAINGVFASGDAIGKIMQDIIASEEAAGRPVGNVNNFMQMMDMHMDKIVCHEEVSKRLANASAYLDVTGYNYMSARYDKDHKENPDRVIVGSETYPPQIPYNWEKVKALSNVIGDFTWTGWDYIGEAGVGIPAYQWGEGGFGAVFPAQLAYTGDIDITGIRRPASYFRELVYGRTKAPYIAVQNPQKYGGNLIKTPWVISDATAAWDYPEMEGKPVKVEVYSAGEEVELLQNGVSLGRQAAGEEGHFYAVFDTTYEPGTLEAVSYEGGKVCGRYALTTPNVLQNIQMEAEAGQTGELVFIAITLTDEAETVVTSDSRLLKASVEGALEVRMGSGNPKPLHNYLDLETNTWNGRAQLIIRKNDPADVVNVTVQSEDGTLQASIQV